MPVLDRLFQHHHLGLVWAALVVCTFACATARAMVLRGFVRAQAAELLAAVQQITAQAPFRHLVTPGGLTMSVAMTNCGALGWVSDRSGYRYDPIDPQTGQAWPAMPLLFRQLAREAAETAGFAGFAPDACLINRYAPGARLSLHQDRDEGNYAHPIVSVSLGVSAMFLWGGAQRAAGLAFLIRVVQDKDVFVTFLVLARGIFGGHPIAVALG